MIIFVRQGGRARIREPLSVIILKGLAPILFLSRGDNKTSSVAFSVSFLCNYVRRVTRQRQWKNDSK